MKRDELPEFENAEEVAAFFEEKYRDLKADFDFECMLLTRKFSEDMEKWQGLHDKALEPFRKHPTPG